LVFLVIPVKLVLAKAGNGNPVFAICYMNHGFPPQFIPAKAGAGMTTFYEVVKESIIRKANRRYGI
jgi:hypothetical protein